MKARKDVAVEISLGSATVFKVGAKRFDFADPYHMAITLPYGAFVATIAFGVVALNALFAIAYWAMPGCISNAHPHSFVDAFFFSMETMATVGYGAMVPATSYGHLVASFESVVGIAFTAVITGIIFVRFSRPRSRMRFADSAIITQHDGKPTLMVRMAYSRTTTLMGVVADLDVMLMHTSKEGRTYRLAQPLKLIRRRMPALILAWTVMHAIDENSPLYGYDTEKLIASEARFMLTIEARDLELGVEVFDLKTYTSDMIKMDVAYRDLVTFDENKNAHADLRLLSDVVPLAG